MTPIEQKADEFFDLHELDVLVVNLANESRKMRSRGEERSDRFEKISDQIRQIAGHLRSELLILPTGKERLEFAEQIEFRCELCAGGRMPEPILEVTKVIRSTYKNDERVVTRAPDPIRWLSTQRDLVYFIRKLAEKNFIEKKAIWKKTSENFCKKDRTEFKPGTLASEAKK